MRVHLLAALFLAFAAAAIAVPHTATAGTPMIPIQPQAVMPDFSLQLATPQPSLGSEVLVRLAAPAGFPAGTQVRWNISGAPFGNAGVKGGNPTEYAFVPNAAGSYVITVELFDGQGVPMGTSMMEISIASSMSQNVAASELYVHVVPEYPKIGQQATLTLQVSSGIPDGCKVLWEVSGGIAGTASGRSGEVFTFVPPSQGPYSVRSRLYRPDGSPMGEVALTLYPVR